MSIPRRSSHSSGPTIGINRHALADPGWHSQGDTSYFPLRIGLVTKDSNASIRKKATMRRGPAIIESVIAHSAKNVSLKELSLSLDVSYSHLSRLIKRNLHYTYSDLKKCLKIQKALKLLAETAKPIKEIVGLAGYKSISHFYKDFRVLAGSTPGDYRTRNAHLSAQTKEQRGQLTAKRSNQILAIKRR